MVYSIYNISKHKCRVIIPRMYKKDKKLIGIGIEVLDAMVKISHFRR